MLYYVEQTLSQSFDWLSHADIQSVSTPQTMSFYIPMNLI